VNPAAIPGAVFVILAGASILTLVGSLFVLWRYRLAVERAMGVNAQVGAEATAAADTGRPLIAAAATRMAGDDRVALFGRAAAAPRVEIACIVAAGLAYAAVLASALLLARVEVRTPWRFALTLWIDAWPIVIAMALSTASFVRTAAIATAAYALLFVVGTVTMIALPDDSPETAGAMLVVLGDTVTPEMMAKFWLVFAAAPAAVVVLFLNPRLRAVSPLTLAFAMVWIAALIAAWTAIVASPFRELPLRLADATHGGWAGWLVLGVAFVVGLAASVVAAWLAARWIRSATLAGTLSDRTLAIDALFLFYAAFFAMVLALVDAVWLLAGLLAFLVYRVVVMVARAQVRRRAVALAPRGLVFLRVFALGEKTSTLFSALAKHWRRVGSMQLIAGPDLAQSTAQPHQLLDFVAGRLSRHFIGDAGGVERAMAAIERAADRDGWYRVHSFFCRADTWQAVLARMVAKGDVVLMDLRSFSAQNAGCEHELRHLVERVPLGRCVFVVDRTTDDAHFRALVAEALAGLDATSPNRGVRADALAVHPFTHGAAGLRSLLQRLCDAG
jgi:hypothetical protein